MHVKVFNNEEELPQNPLKSSDSRTMIQPKRSVDGKGCRQIPRKCVNRVVVEEVFIINTL